MLLGHCHYALMHCQGVPQLLPKSALQVRDWYVDSFMELRKFPEIKVKRVARHEIWRWAGLGLGRD